MTDTPAPAIDYQKLGEAVAKAMAPAFTQALTPLAEQIGKLQAPATDAAAPGAQAKPLTVEDINKAVADQLKTFTAGQQQSQARESFLGEKLKDLPAAYRNQLGNDPSKWAAEEQTIRDAYKADLKAAGGTVPNVSGNPNGGQAPAAAINPAEDKRSPQQLILDGLKSAQTAGPNATTSRGTTATA